MECLPETGSCIRAVPSYYLLLLTCLSTGSWVGNCYDSRGLGFCFFTFLFVTSLGIMFLCVSLA